MSRMCFTHIKVTSDLRAEVPTNHQNQCNQSDITAAHSPQSYYILQFFHDRYQLSVFN